MLGIVLDQTVIEKLARYRIQSKIWLIEERQFRPRSEADNDSNC